MQFNNFYLESDKEEDDTNKKPLLGAEKTYENSRQIFIERMKSFGNYLKILSVIQVIIILLGKVYIDVGDYLTCTGNGFMWISTSIHGELFVAGIMVTIMM